MYLGDLEAVLRKTREIVKDVVAGNAESVDREAFWPEQNIRTLQAAGLGGLVVRRAYGGSNQGLLALAQVCELLGRECGSTAICFGMHCVGASVISANPTPYQKEQYLEPISQGKHFTPLPLPTPATGAH